MDTATRELKNRENRLRVRARREGLSLKKDRTRNAFSVRWGMYYLVDPSNRNMVEAQTDDIDIVEGWFSEG